VTSSNLSYAVVTPARDEAPNLRRLAACMLAQTQLPQAWVIVDNGSVDETFSYARELSERHPWVAVALSGPTAAAEPGAPIVRAFLAGVERLEGPVDVLVKLDADVSFESTHFAKLLDAFASDSALGMAGSVCLEERDGTWTEVTVSAFHVRGAVRAYRWQCFQDVSPIEVRLGWDTVDELKAYLAGWKTGTIDGITFRHHRVVGARDGKPWERARRQGRASYYLGYRSWYLFMRAVRRSLDSPAALAMVWGYFEAAWSRAPRQADEAVRREVRRRQSVRQLPARLEEAIRDISFRLGRQRDRPRSAK
jgi:poly-beta-1,6-N-acetyl-D-glucosamine synthase